MAWPATISARSDSYFTASTSRRTTTGRPTSRAHTASVKNFVSIGQGPSSTLTSDTRLHPLGSFCRRCAAFGGSRHARRLTSVRVPQLHNRILCSWFADAGTIGHGCNAAQTKAINNGSMFKQDQLKKMLNISMRNDPGTRTDAFGRAGCTPTRGLEPVRGLGRAIR